MFGATALPIVPLDSIRKLPFYAFQFFFQNLHGFRLVFWTLTVVSVLSAALGFLAAYLLGALITDLSNNPKETAVVWYAIAYAVVLTLRETFDLLIRRYGEAFATIYSDHLRLRFLKTLLSARYSLLQNILPERLSALVGKYTGNVESFLNEWFWGVSRRAVSFILVMTTFALQGWSVFLANAAFMAFFLSFAFSVSKRFAPVAARYSERSLESSAVSGNVSMHLTSLLRLGRVAFFLGLTRSALASKWQAFDAVRRFSAWRWFAQLNLFNVMYAGTLFYGALQVVEGTLSIGFLVLVRYAFDRLWDLSVYIIEYYVSLVQQRQDSALVRKELALLFPETRTQVKEIPSAWQHLTIAGAHVQFEDPRSHSQVSIGVEHLTITRGARYGILGPSGIGKSTVLLMLLNAIEYEGRLECDGVSIRDAQWQEGAVSMVTNKDPLFRCSVRDNILLGREISPEKLNRVLQGLHVHDFCKNLEVRVGDPSTNFSAGQEQRVRLARALVGDEPLLLMDEPFNGIDEATKASIIAFLDDYLENRTLVLVTHVEQELRLVERVFRFDGRKLT